MERLPGYTLMRSLSRQLTGQEEGVSFSPALVEIEEALVPAFLVEEHEDGSYTVFVPASPTPTIGLLISCREAWVHPVDIPFAKAVKCVSQWGWVPGSCCGRCGAPRLRPKPQRAEITRTSQALNFPRFGRALQPR